MNRRVALSAAAAVAGAVAALTVAVPAANALPTTVSLTTGHNPTGAIFTAGTGHIRSWQLCESSNGQTDFYINGPWVGINTWSWSGNCLAYYRGHGFDVN